MAASCSGAHPGGHSLGLALGAQPGVCALANPGASNSLSASSPSTYKEQRSGCSTSLNPGAGPVAAPRSPHHGNLPTTPHPRWASSALYAPKWLSSPGQPSIASWQIFSRTANSPRDQLFYSHCSSIFCLLNYHTRVLVISPTLYYVISRTIISRAYYSYTTSYSTHVFYE